MRVNEQRYSFSGVCLNSFGEELKFRSAPMLGSSWEERCLINSECRYPLFKVTSQPLHFNLQILKGGTSFFWRNVLGLKSSDWIRSHARGVTEVWYYRPVYAYWIYSDTSSFHRWLSSQGLYRWTWEDAQIWEKSLECMDSKQYKGDALLKRQR